MLKVILEPQPLQIGFGLLVVQSQGFWMVYACGLVPFSQRPNLVPYLFVFRVSLLRGVISIASPPFKPSRGLKVLASLGSSMVIYAES